jgi:hypothetical protein
MYSRSGDLKLTIAGMRILCTAASNFPILKAK